MAAVLLWLAVVPAFAATLLPNGEQTFLDDNGDPLAAGTVQFYIPLTSTPKDTWRDADQGSLNTNPVLLDSAGRAIIYGDGCYRQVVEDSLGNPVWDQETCSTEATASNFWGGTSSGSANAQTIVVAGYTAAAGQSISFIAGFSNTGAMTLNPNSTGGVNVFKESPTGPVALTGGEVVAGNLITVAFDGTRFQLITNNQVLIGPLTNLVAAATTSLGTIASHNVNITGITGITSFGSAASTAYPYYFLTFAGALTITHNASSMILPGAANLTVAAGDTAQMMYLGSSNWRMTVYSPNSLPVRAALPPSQPCGRLALSTGVPVTTADLTAITTLFYTPYQCATVPVYDGTYWTQPTFSETSQTLADATKSPLAAAASSLYDVFVWSDAGTIRATRGPAWTNATSRSAGTVLVAVNGIQMNSVSITNGPAAQRGVYVGTISTSATGANGQLNVMLAPTAAAGGTANRIDIWNMYHRVTVASLNRDNTDSWNYTLATWRAANAAAASGVANRITIVAGLNEDAVSATANGLSSNGSTASRAAGIGLDSTTTFIGSTGTQRNNTGDSTSMTATFSGLPGLGSHFIQWLEYSEAAGTTVWYGDGGAANYEQSGIQIQWRY